MVPFGCLTWEMTPSILEESKFTSMQFGGLCALMSLDLMKLMLYAIRWAMSVPLASPKPLKTSKEGTLCLCHI